MISMVKESSFFHDTWQWHRPRASPDRHAQNLQSLTSQRRQHAAFDRANGGSEVENAAEKVKK